MSDDADERIRRLSPARRALLSLKLGAGGDGPRGVRAEAIAVLGLGCRLPGGIASPAAFWRMLREGRQAITEVPSDRWNVDAYWDPRPATPGKMYSRWGGFVDGIDAFDAAFFGIAPREAVSMDPQQRLVLEVAWEALEHAGLPPDELAGSETGVFMGVCRTDYAQLHGLAEHPAAIDAHFGTGNAGSFVAGRLAYVLGLHGPCVAVDTACSSSLVAVHLACQSLRLRECDLALAGGVNVILSPGVNVYLSQIRAFAADGRIKAFDAAADGYVRGEGCGVVALKRLADAQRDGDHVLAVIAGSAVNQDGRSAGLTAPSGPAQAAVVRRAVNAAGLAPADVQFVEAHGTGTVLGDPIEVRALASVLGEGRAREHAVALGSVKTNIGHLEAAAGVAGLIKVVLALQHGEIPPHLNFRTPNPHVGWDALPVSVPTTLAPWPAVDERRIAGISSFGFSGTNAHVVLEQAPPGPAAPRTEGPGPWLVPLSARSPQALQALARAWVTYGDDAAAPALQDLAPAAARRRGHHEHRLAVLADAPATLLDALRAGADEAPHPALVRAPVPEARPRVVFVCSGLGPLAPAHVRELLAGEPVFEAAFAEAAAALARLGGPALPAALDAAAGPEAPLALAQPTLFAIQVGLGALWQAWGVGADAVVGHSLGEVAAAYLAGALSLAEAARVVMARSRRLDAAAGGGAMLATDRAAEALAPWLAAAPGVALAADNGPRATVVAGAIAAVRALATQLQADGATCRWLPSGGVAGHTGLLGRAAQGLAHDLAGLAPSAPRIPLVSTLTGEWLDAAAPRLDASYWSRQLCEPVLFARAIRAVLATEPTLVLELAPQPMLTAPLTALVDALAPGTAVVPTLRADRSARAGLLAALGHAYVRGLRVAWAHVYPERGRPVDLPSYPWQRQRYWIEPRRPAEAPCLLTAEDVSRDATSARVVDELVQRWGREGSLAVNRRYLAPEVFLGGDRRSLFFVSQTNAGLVAFIYVGPDDAYGALVEELDRYTAAHRRALTVLARDDGLAALRRLGFTATPCGTFQTIADLSSFTLDGTRMRRLRYWVRRYARLGDGEVVEYVPGTEPRTDAAITRLARAWAALRGQPGALADRLTQALLGAGRELRCRVFLARRDGTVDAAIVLSPAPATNGYLLDLEFYGAETPAGCVEFAITRIIEQLRSEGRASLSLGGTFGSTGASEAEGDPDLSGLLGVLHVRGILNGDGNVQFKSKFRPEVSRLYVCRPRGREAPDDSDLLRALRTHAEPPAVPPGGTDAAVLLGERLDLALGDAVFESTLDAGALPLLAGHRVAGVPVLPGAGYLAMALLAGRRVLGNGALVLSDVTIRRPLTAQPGELYTLQLVLRREGPTAATFEIASRPAGEAGAWRVHAAGRLSHEADDKQAESRSTEDVQHRCTGGVSAEALYERLASRGLDYGPMLRLVEHVWRRDGEALASLRPPLATDAEGLDPSVLDGGLQILAVAAPQSGADTGPEVLWSVERLALAPSALPCRWSHARFRTLDPPVADVTLLDARGEVVVDIAGIHARPARLPTRIDDTNVPARDWTYEVAWEPAAQERPTADEAGTWVLLADAGGAADALAATLRAAGDRAIVLSRDEATEPAALCDRLSRLHREAPGLRGLVHLRGLDGRVESDATAEAVAAAARVGAESALHALRALTALESSARLWIVTQGAQSLTAAASGLAQAPLWGLGAVAALEHPEAWVGLVDLDPQAPAVDQASALGKALRESGERVALRGGRRFVARLVRRPLSTAAPALRLDAEATYLIAGGTGGLGLEIARLLVERGARALALLARSAPSTAARAVIAELQGMGARVVVEQVDVAFRDPLAAALARVRASMPPLRGVVHAAGVLHDGLLARQSWPGFEAVLGPKLAGAWNLHALTEHDALQFFALFSSAAAVLGSPAQGNHAAANAFLDALAHYRRARGLPALSIGWGAWSHVGAAAGPGLQARLAADGSGPIPPDIGVGLFEALLHTDMAHAVVLPIDWDRWRATAGSRGLALVARLLEPPEVPRLERARPARRSVRRALLAEPGADRPHRLQAYLRGECARVLGVAENDLDPARPLALLGLDSIMIVELRDRIEADLQMRLPLTHFFREPSVAELAAVMLAVLTDGAEPAPGGERDGTMLAAPVGEPGS